MNNFIPLRVSLFQLSFLNIKKKTYIYFLILLLFSNTYGQTWSSNGPFGARITAIAINPIDTTIIYAGTFGKGIYRSNDAGNSWQLINGGLPKWETKTFDDPNGPSWHFGNHHPVNTLLVSKNNPDHIFVGLHGGGFTFSKNGGDTWEALNEGLPEAANILTLWEHPNNSDLLLCGASFPGESGLFKSLDRGKSWIKIQDFDETDVLNIINNPKYPDSIYISTRFGLYISTDGSSTWDLLNAQLEFYKVIIDTLNNKLISFGQNGWGEQKLLQSNDGGVNWIDFPTGENWYTTWFLYKDAHNRLFVFKEDENQLKISNDFGVNWEDHEINSNFGNISAINFGRFTSDIFAVNPKNPESIYIGTEVGFFHSTDGSNTYILKENGMTNTYINAIAVSDKAPDIVYAGGENGLWKSEDKGKTWKRLGKWSINAISIDKNHPDTAYFGGATLRRTYDGGNTIDYLGGGTVTAIEVHPRKSNIVFIAKYASVMYKSEDYGKTLDLSFSGEPGQTFRIENIRIHDKTDSSVYLGNSSPHYHSFFRSLDLGNTWEKLSTVYTTKIQLHPISTDSIFVSNKDSIVLSTNGGISFTKISHTLPSNNIASVLLEPNEDYTIFGATKDQGLFYKTKTNNEWFQVEGDYDPRISEIAWLPDNNIYLATHGDGVWLGEQIISFIENPSQCCQRIYPFNIELFPPYPNPFNNYSIIRFSLQKKTRLSIKIFDVLGKEIKSFIKKDFNAGTHYIKWDGTNNNNQIVNSGLFFLVITNERDLLSQKLILLK